MAKFVGNVAWQGIDMFFGISDMIHDVNVLGDPNASGWDKLLAGLDLGYNVASNVSLLFGVGAALKAGRASKIGFKALKNSGDDLLKLVCSFDAKTVVSTTVGLKAIDSLVVGEKVLAYNEETKEMEWQPIEHVWINHENDLVDLTMTSNELAKDGKSTTQTQETLHTNEKHPFFTQEKGFISVADIHVGMHIIKADGTVGKVTGWQARSDARMMYNLEVAVAHTYTVGEEQWIVHNSGKACVGDVTGDLLEMVEKNWSPGNTSAVESFVYHYNAHGSQVGANSMRHYLDKAISFRSNVLNNKHAVSKPIDAVNGLTTNVRHWYLKNVKSGNYINLDMNDSTNKIVSYGKRWF